MHRQGEVVDIAYRERTMGTVREWCKRVRDLGVLVGVGTHKPEVIELAKLNMLKMLALGSMTKRSPILMGHAPFKSSDFSQVNPTAPGATGRKWSHNPAEVRHVRIGHDSCIDHGAARRG